MWQQLAIGGVKGLMDRQSQLTDIESNGIKSKYGTWTGEKADWSSVSKNPFGDAMMKGLGAGLADMKAGADADAVKQADYLAQQKKEGEGYTRGQIGTPIAGGGPARPTVMQPPKAASSSSFASAVPSFLQGQKNDGTPLMLQGRDPAGQNPWLQMAGAKEPVSEPMMDKAPQENPWNSITQRPLLPTEVDQTPGKSSFDATASNRAALWGAIPDSSPVKWQGGQAQTATLPSLSMPDFPGASASDPTRGARQAIGSGLTGGLSAVARGSVDEAKRDAYGLWNMLPSNSPLKGSFR